MGEPLICQHCEEPILDGELSPQPVNAPMHFECAARGVLGSVAHIERRCSCFVEGSEEGDPPEMTKRQAARAALEAYSRYLAGEVDRE